MDYMEGLNHLSVIGMRGKVHFTVQVFPHKIDPDSSSPFKSKMLRTLETIDILLEVGTRSLHDKFEMRTC